MLLYLFRKEECRVVWSMVKALQLLVKLVCIMVSLVTQQPTESRLTESGFLPIYSNFPKNNLDSPNFQLLFYSRLSEISFGQIWYIHRYMG